MNTEPSPLVSCGWKMMRKKLDADNPISEVYNVLIFTFLYPTFFQVPLTPELLACIYFPWELFEMKYAVENNLRFMKIGSSAVETLETRVLYIYLSV